MAERILFAVPQSTLGYREHDKAAPSQKTADIYRDAIQRILNNDRTRTLTLSNEAENDLREFRRRIESMLRPTGRLAEFAGWGSKLPGQLARIAGLLHLVKAPDVDEIDHSTMTLALDLGALLIDHALAAFIEMGIDQVTLDARRCWQWIAGKDSFSRGELTTAMRHSMKASQITAALSVLANHHFIDSAKGTPVPKSREITFTVNPLTRRK